MAASKKSGRLEIIKMIVSSQELSTQEELQRELDIAGYPTSQATLVRDLRQLHIVKGQNQHGRYVYLMPSEQRFRTVSDTHVTVDSLNRLGAISVKFSGNLGVIHTPPGHAGHVAYDIDHAEIPEILGTVAGDDTVLVVLAENADRVKVMDDLSKIV
ncbi:MAG: arginine repressor [Bacteroidaceae bacterium]|nr:arginine repressor [Bacteroidaceae bacterium]